MLDNIRAPTKSPRRLAPRKDAGRSLRTVERERCPRAGARHLRTRAASGKRPAGITTGLRVDRWTGTGDGGVTAAESASQEARLELSGGVGSLPLEPRWNAGRRSAPRWARAASRRVRIGGVASAGVPPALFLCFVFFVGWAEQSEAHAVLGNEMQTWARRFAP